jgi:tRNA pseudouridine55 synthase
MFFSKDRIVTQNHQPSFSDFNEGVVFLIDKPLDWTSFDVVNKLRFKIKHSLKLKKIKVGHAGTLDPLASGLLIVCCGKATKYIGQLQNLDKSYSGTMQLGASTPSYDAESEPDRYYPTDHIDAALINAAVPEFTGQQMQVPPLFSAIKVNGKKGYELARRGSDITLDARSVLIHSFEIDAINFPLIHFTVSCSKGTYIRSLAHDFGKALGSGAYLSSLRRESIDQFHVKDALTVEEAVEYIGSLGISE